MASCMDRYRYGKNSNRVVAETLTVRSKLKIKIKLKLQEFIIIYLSLALGHRQTDRQDV